MNTKLALIVGWLVGLTFYLVDVLERARGYIGFSPNVKDAIAVLLLVGVAALVWRRAPDPVSGGPR